MEEISSKDYLEALAADCGHETPEGCALANVATKNDAASMTTIADSVAFALRGNIDPIRQVFLEGMHVGYALALRTLMPGES
jgi:hypothetical protein